MIKVYADLLSEELCNKMIDLFQKDTLSQVEGVVSAPGVESYRSDEYLVSTDILIGQESPWHSVNAILHEQFLAPVLADYLSNFKMVHYGKTYLHPESAIMSLYPTGSGHFAPHKDITVTDYCRDITIIIYLNDVHSGGCTHFFNQAQSIAPTRGSIALFPSGFEYAHEGQTPKSNDKFIIVTFAEVQIERVSSASG